MIRTTAIYACIGALGLACGSEASSHATGGASTAPADDGGATETPPPSAPPSADAATPSPPSAPEAGAIDGAANGDPAPLGSSGGAWRLTFRDEFDGSALDASKWSDLWGVAPNQWGNVGWSAELMTRDAVSVGNGQLHIRQWQNPNVLVDGHPRIESGVVHTQGHFFQTYGYFEARLRVVGRPGVLNAWWLAAEQGWPPELDVTEVLGKDPTISNMTEHYDSDNKTEAGTVTGSDLSAGFHVYGAEWTASTIRWYLDGKVVQEKPNHLAADQHLILNMHAGNSWAGTPSYSDTTPRYMDVDYVRAWQR